uniref:Uncharacterized protein n=1 Tax=Timema shepardi TaxID=629360 RepID=A0A7R9FZD9_TIMSH|nr:unnamed protein product [Timema shepardi]
MERLCRICAHKGDDDLVPIFKGRGKHLHLDQVINSHLPIKVCVSDVLPVHVCTECLDKLLVCEALAVECLQAERTLKAMLNQACLNDACVLGATRSRDSCESARNICDKENEVREDEISVDLLMDDSCDNQTDAELMLANSNDLKATEEMDKSQQMSFHSSTTVRHLHGATSWSEILKQSEISDSDDMLEENHHESDMNLNSSALNKELSLESALEMMLSSEKRRGAMFKDSKDVSSPSNNKLNNDIEEKTCPTNQETFLDRLCGQEMCCESSMDIMSSGMMIHNEGELVPLSNFGVDMHLETLNVSNIPELNVDSSLDMLTDSEVLSSMDKEIRMSTMGLLSDHEKLSEFDLDHSISASDLMDGRVEILDLELHHQLDTIPEITLDNTEISVLAEPVERESGDREVHLSIKEVPTIKDQPNSCIRVIPQKHSKLGNPEKRNIYSTIKVKRAGRVNMIVMKAENTQRDLPQAKLEAKEKDQLPTLVSCETPAVKLESVAKMNLVNVALMPNTSDGAFPRQVPYLHMKVSGGFESIEENAKNTIVGVIHNLVGQDKGSVSSATSTPIEKGYKCSVCGAHFDLWRTWRLHEKDHLSTREPRCDTCNKVFKNENSLRFHRRRHIIGAPAKCYECKTCGKSFTSRVPAVEHERIHTGERPFQCPLCPKAFIRKFTLKQHLSSHARHQEIKKMAKTEFKCAMCGKVSGNQMLWQAHTRVHLGELPFQCSGCNKGFASIRTLRPHMRKCDNVLPKDRYVSINSPSKKNLKKSV